MNMMCSILRSSPVGLALSVSLFAATSLDAQSTTVSACVNNSSGAVKIVGPSTACNGNETLMTWNVTGPEGSAGSEGPVGPQGIPGTDGVDATLPDPPCFDNTNRYVDCGNGTVTDTVTGLVWLKDAACLGSADYADANRAAAALANGQCGLTDKSSPGNWRLPNKDEWTMTIARGITLGCMFAFAPNLTNDPGTGCLLFGPTSFTGVATAAPGYWSSDSFVSSPAIGMNATMHNGGVFGVNKVDTLRVWPVRGGPR